MTAGLSDSPVGGASAALLLARGICRTLDQLGYASLTEFPLANGRRADILALGKTGDLVIIEIKSSVADFRADRKWTGYREFADRLYFAVPNETSRCRTNSRPFSSPKNVASWWRTPSGQHCCATVSRPPSPPPDGAR
jgi:hypothetical protein